MELSAAEWYTTELPVAERQQPQSDHVLMEKGAQATMAGRCPTFREE